LQRRAQLPERIVHRAHLLDAPKADELLDGHDQQPGQRRPLIFALMNLLCLLATLAIFFTFTYPANQATNNWTEIPVNWEQLRWQWEVSHAVDAVITFIGFCSLTISVLLARKQTAD
jgi:hypothetical protein